MRLLKTTSVFIAIVFISVFSYTTAHAQENLENDAYKEIVNTLNYETVNVYDDYVSVVKELNADDANTINNFEQKLSVWKSILNETDKVYDKYKMSSYPKISEIAQTASEANGETLLGIEYYTSGFGADTKTQMTAGFNNGDTHFLNGGSMHSNSVVLYNNYSGVTEAYSTRDWLIFFTILSALFSLVLFIKSMNRSSLNADIMRASVYRNLFASSMWPTIGLAITTASYYSALKNGGSYYIFGGAILIGGWQLLKGLIEYFTNGRKILNKLSREAKDTAIKSSYNSTTDRIYDIEEKKCKNCGAAQPKTAIVCSSCGFNLL